MKMGGGCLKFWKNWKILDLGVVKILKKNIEEVVKRNTR